jgi:hypothetical protein
LTWLRVALVACWLLAALGARADPSEDAEPSEPGGVRTLAVTLVGAAGRDATIAARVTSWFDAARFRCLVAHAPRLDAAQVLAPAGDAQVFVWVTLPAADSARLYFATRSGDHQPTSYLLRDLALEHGLDEIGMERIAQVLYASTRALLAGDERSERVELERAIADEPVAVPSTTVEPRKRSRPSPPNAPGAGLRVDAGVGYAASYRASEGIWHGPRASVRVGRFLGVGFAVQGILPTGARSGPVDLELSGASGLACLSVQARLSRQVRLEGFAGGGVDWIHYASHSIEPTVAAGAGATEARPQVTAGLTVRVWQPLGLAVSGEVSLPLERTHYDLVGPHGPHPIARALAAAPTLGVEFGF